MDDQRSLIEDLHMPDLRETAEDPGPEGYVDLRLEGDGDLPDGGAPSPEAEQAAAAEDAEEVARTPLLFHSNAPWAGTGYGAQAALFGPLIHAELDYDVAFSAFFGLQGRRIGWISPHTGTAHAVYPLGRDHYGNDVIVAHYQHHAQRRPGLVVTLTDVWVLRAQTVAALPALAWTPVDHDPVHEMTTAWFKKSGAIPVAMSRFGEEQLKAAGLKNTLYVPHGFNADVFRPADRGEVRRELGLPEDAFIVGMVAANVGYPSRKSFSECLLAFAEFQRTHPDAVLYLHTLLQNPGGDDLVEMADSLGIKFLSCDQYGYVLGPPEQMVAAALNAFDVLLNPARGEGFGVPLIEAQACGTPCIVTEFSALPEVAPESAGNWYVQGQRIWTQFSSWQVIPFVDSIIMALEDAYDEPEEERLARRVRVWEHSAKYEAVRVTREFWAPALSTAREEINWRNKRGRRT